MCNGRSHMEQEPRSSRITVIIPCYRSEKYLQHTVEEILAEAERSCRDNFRIILVDDCSPDNTVRVIRDLCRQYEGRISAILLEENAGQTQAKTAAFQFMREGIVITMDDDGQHDPAAMFLLENKILENYDVVYAQFPKNRESLPRRLSSYMMNILLTLFTKKPWGLHITSYMAFNMAAISELNKYRSRHPFFGGWLFMHGYKAAGVPVRHRVRETGTSGYTLKKLFLRAIEMTILYRIPPKKDDPPAFRIREIIGRPGE